jgi:glutaredoxin-dependent peroxiredoxin
MSTKLRIGDNAPDFTLPDTELKYRNLRDFLGSVVILVFFVNAFTAVCTKEMCEFRDSAARLTKLKTRTVGISVNDPFSSKAFAEKNKLFFPILSDYNREVIRSHGLEDSDFEGIRGYTVAKRSIVVLDSKGIIRYFWIAREQREEPDYQALEKFLLQIA